VVVDEFISGSPAGAKAAGPERPKVSYRLSKAIEREERRAAGCVHGTG